ncbi:restriction endonuclease subunit S [Enterococcus devriesei]|uniref:restriction endonuclease subunit S n=1 Tax=Enterococcus devriesei TaxID=319970 RepID=UPI0028AAF33B|nr:restriction endonuclease subunit S [Enterococcus devriesei]
MKYKKVKLKDIIFFNPKETIKKNQLAKKIPMDALIPFTRKVGYYEVKEFNSGTKFRNNDTLMARITPCLENGKTAYVNILNEDEIAFGSTEYFVLRADENYILPKYLYYISISDKLRNVAIKSMTGTSGRQRAQKESILDFEIELPSISIQKKVLSILDSIDSKIELNNQIISNLEELASTLFKRWFVDFEFPDENGNPYKSSGGKMVDSELGEIPEGWEINPLSSIAKITSGKRPDVKKTNPDKDNIIPIVGASKIMGYTNQVLENGSIITTGRVGTHGIIQRYREKVWVSDNSFIIKSDTEEFLNQILLRIDYKNLNRGSTQPLITQTDLKKYKIVLPSSKFIEMFESVISKLTECEFQIKKQNLNLEKIRDSLLPKLLSGEIELTEDEGV